MTAQRSIHESTHRILLCEDEHRVQNLDHRVINIIVLELGDLLPLVPELLLHVLGVLIGPVLRVRLPNKRSTQRTLFAPIAAYNP
jgi:hypothetical protein